jgi:hypothetical protein
VKKLITLVALFFTIMEVVSYAQEKNPVCEIKNKLIHARVYLPDQESGYYRSTRFDWSGVMSKLVFNSHNYLGIWNDLYDPTLHDAITGPVEEFAPLGYDLAKAGSSFVKIGVGILHKPEELKYNKFTYYQIEDYGKRKVRKKSDQITFIHTLEHKDYGYKYEKTVKLIKGKPVLEISHTLKNKGQRPIETTVYDHNFFVIDSTNLGPAFEVKFPFTIKADEKKIGEIAEIKDNRITFKRELTKGEIISLGAITGYSNDPRDYDIRIENQKTGAAVRITADQPISRIIFWAMPKTLCPEPYISIRIEPGKEFSWKLTYEFYTIDRQK